MTLKSNTEYVKPCKNCNKQLPITDFCKNSRYKSGYTAWCKPCHNDYNKTWGKANPDKKYQSHRKSRVKRFKITPEEYDRMNVSQSYNCKICKGKNYNNYSLAIDHCHKTGKVRGLLCSACNTAIGMFKDNPELLQAAIQYLKESTNDA